MTWRNFMENKKLLVMMALSGLISGLNNPNVLAKEGYVECKGIAPSGSNSCAGNAHACAGYAQTDWDKEEWVYVQEGSCANIQNIKEVTASVKSFIGLSNI